MRIKPDPVGPGQESVWDYPRPPLLEPSSESIRVEAAGLILAQTTRAMRVLETSHPPVYYIPPEDVRREHLERTEHHSFCEWKGGASYVSLGTPERRIEKIAWFYPTPSERFAPIANYLAFYPSKVDACFVDDERVEAQEGDFYGGWITSRIVGPFKGAPGTWGW